MKYAETKVTFAEIPDEITLCINISGCQIRCPECHSKWLWENIGEELTENTLIELVEKNKGISCICFMGGSEEEVKKLLPVLQEKQIRAAWYTGLDKLPDLPTQMLLDYVKVGPYIPELGPLTSETTNQRLYRIDKVHTLEPGFREDAESLCTILQDITSKFWKKYDPL